MSSVPFPSVSAIVVTYLSGPALKECINALCVETQITEIIVVNNGNSESDYQWLSEFKAPEHCRYQLVSGHGNIGFAAAVNLGARHSTGERFLIINPDAVLRVHSVPELEKARAQGAAPCLVGGKLIYPSGQEQRGARRDMLTPARALATFTGLHKLQGIFPKLRNMHKEHEPEPTSPLPMPVVSGALCYISNEDYWRINGFDEGYFLHVEDIDFCRRIAEAGGEVMYTPFAVALHYGSTSQVSAMFVEYNKAKGLTRYFYKNAETPVGRFFARASFYGFAPLLVTRSVVLRSLMSTRQRIRDWRINRRERHQP